MSTTTHQDKKRKGIGGALRAGIATVGQSAEDAVTKLAKGTQTVGQKVFVEPAKAVTKQMDQGAVLKPVQKAIQGVGEATKSAGQQVGSLVSAGKQSHKRKSAVAEGDQTESASVREMALPPDEQLMSMDILFTKQLAQTSVRDWYDKFWNDKSIYIKFWEAGGKQDVVISDWEGGGGEEEEAGEIHNPYDQENYSHRRDISFHFETTIIGRSVTPNLSTVEHLRISDDRCVVAVATDASGVPFGDAFQVQLRWVGTRIDENDLLLQLGLYVLFRKSVLVAGQIRSTTREESLDTQTELFHTMKDACGAEETAAMAVTIGETELLETTNKFFDLCSKPPADLFRMCIPQKSEQVFQDDLERELFQVSELLQTVRELPLIDDQRASIQSALFTVEDALDAILIRKLGLEDTTIQSKEKVDRKFSLGSRLVTTMSSPIEGMHSVFLNRTSRTKEKMSHSKFARFLLSSVTSSDKGSSRDADTDPSFDEGLQSMSVVVSKSIDNTTIDNVYDFLAKEDRTTKKPSLYETWLSDSGKMEVKVGDWESNNEMGFVDDWSKESYQQKRIVSFQSPQKTNFGIQQETGVVDVKQVLYRRKEARKYVLATTEEHVHGPFSKIMKIHRRLVVSQVEDKKVSFKCGVFVLFTRQLILAPKIRASETKETRHMYTELYKLTRAALSSESVRMSLNERFEFKNIEDEPPACFLRPLEGLRHMFRFCSTPALQDDAEFQQKFKTIHAKLKTIEDILDDREANTMEDLNFYSGEMVVAREALDDVLSSSLSS